MGGLADRERDGYGGAAPVRSEPHEAGAVLRDRAHERSAPSAGQAATASLCPPRRSTHRPSGRIQICLPGFRRMPVDSVTALVESTVEVPIEKTNSLIHSLLNQRQAPLYEQPPARPDASSALAFDATANPPRRSFVAHVEISLGPAEAVPFAASGDAPLTGT